MAVSGRTLLDVWGGDTHAVSRQPLPGNRHLQQGHRNLDIQIRYGEGCVLTGEGQGVYGVPCHSVILYAHVPSPTHKHHIHTLPYIYLHTCTPHTPAHIHTHSTHPNICHAHTTHLYIHTHTHTHTHTHLHTHFNSQRFDHFFRVYRQGQSHLTFPKGLKLLLRLCR